MIINRTTLFHFILSCVVLAFVVALALNPVWRHIFAANIFYFIALGGAVLFPLIYLKSIQWILGGFSLWTWSFFLGALGIYYVWFQEPNIIAFLVDFKRGYPLMDRLPKAFYGLLSYAGLSSMYYFLVRIITPPEERKAMEVISPSSFALKMSFYLIYLNGVVLILNAFFLKNI